MLNFYVLIDGKPHHPITLCDKHLRKSQEKSMNAEWRLIGESRVRCKHCLNSIKLMLRAKAIKNNQIAPQFEDSFYYQLQDIQNPVNNEGEDDG